jgi:hypothetical protein
MLQDHIWCQAHLVQDDPHDGQLQQRAQVHLDQPHAHRWRWARALPCDAARRRRVGSRCSAAHRPQPRDGNPREAWPVGKGLREAPLPHKTLLLRWQTISQQHLQRCC